MQGQGNEAGEPTASSVGFKEKTATAAASAMKDTAAATMAAATTVLAVLEFITPLSRACVSGWKLGEQIRRVGSFISPDTTGSGAVSDTSESSESQSMSQESSCSPDSADFIMHEDEDKHPAASMVHSTDASKANAKDWQLSASSGAPGHILQHNKKFGDKFQHVLPSAQPVAESFDDHSVSTQNAVVFHGFRDSLGGEDSTTGNITAHTFSFTAASSAPGSQGQNGMSRITRTRLLRCGNS